MVQSVSVEHIEVSSKIRAGKPRIIGTRIAVEDIALMHLKLGHSLIEIAGIYDLSLAAVYAAMAYYFDHREEIDRRLAEEIALLAEMEKEQTSSLREKLEQMKGG